MDPVDGILELLGDLAGENRAGWAASAQSERVAGLAYKTRRHADVYARHEDVLLDAAATLGVDDFKIAAEKWRLLAHEERAKRDKAGAVEHAEFHLSPTFGGRYAFGGDLDSEGAKTVLDALDARCRPGPAGKPTRTLGERRAEALVEMAAASLAAGSPAGHPPATAPPTSTTSACSVAAITSWSTKAAGSSQEIRWAATGPPNVRRPGQGRSATHRWLPQSTSPRDCLTRSSPKRAS